MNNILKNKYFNFSDYSIFITGATGYLGTQISLHMADLGAKVILNGRNLSKLKKLQKIIKNKNLKSEISCFDINNEKYEPIPERNFNTEKKLRYVYLDDCCEIFNGNDSIPYVENIKYFKKKSEKKTGHGKERGKVVRK